jgi:hypothetical protein
MRFLGCLLVNLGPHFNLSKRFNLRILDLQFLLHFQTLRWEVHLIQSMRYLQINLIITMKKVLIHQLMESSSQNQLQRQASEFGGAFEGQTHILGGQDRIFKKVLLFAHAVVTGLLSPPPQEIRPLSKGGDIPRNTAPGGRIS